MVPMKPQVATALAKLDPDEIEALRVHFIEEHRTRQEQLAALDAKIRGLRQRRARMLATERRVSRFAPYGFTLTDSGAVVEDPRERAAVQRAVELHRQGRSFRQIGAVRELGAVGARRARLRRRRRPRRSPRPHA